MRMGPAVSLSGRPSSKLEVTELVLELAVEFIPATCKVTVGGLCHGMGIPCIVSASPTHIPCTNRTRQPRWCGIVGGYRGLDRNGNEQERM